METSGLVEHRVYQDVLLNDASRLMRRGVRSVLLQSATGSGKTTIAAKLLARVTARGKRAWFVVHRSELVDQASGAFARQQIPHGYIAAGYAADARQAIQVAMIQSANRRLNLEPPDLIVWDEAHHCPSKTYESLRARYPNAYHLGLTATPERLDGRGLGRYFEEMIQGPSVNWLIENGYLADYRLFAPPGPILVGIKQRAGDYAQDVLASVMDKPRILGCAVDHYRKHADGLKGLCFCVSIQHSQHMAEQFRAAGIHAVHVDGDTPDKERRQAIEAFRLGTTRILCNVDLFGEGVDVPDAAVGLLLRPTQSLGLHLQQMGRLLRPKPDGSKAILLDHAGNTRRHGLPDSEREWTLADREARKPKDRDPEAAVRVCPACFAACKATATLCSECGHPFPIKPRKVETIEGELVEADRKLLNGHGLPNQFQIKSLEGLKEYGRRKSYRSGWAEYVFKARQARVK